MGIILLAGFVLSLAAPAICRLTGRACGWVLALAPASITVYLLSLIPAIARGERLTWHWEWVPTLGIGLTFQVDGLGLLFGLVVAGVGTLIFIYGGGYLAGHQQIGHFFAYVSLFMASMLGVVLADNIVALFVFWELTSISSFLLIGFYHERDSARAAAWQALLVTAGGGVALLGGLLLLWKATGVMRLSEMAAMAPAITAHELYVPAVLLLVLAAFTKSAQFPFHFWLPNAMEAPAPVSAYLHAAAMVKAGIYLLARLHPILGGSILWFYLLTGAGAITMVLGAYLGFQKKEFKKILAYSTVSALGVLVFLLGLGTEAAARAAVAFFLAHALYKGGLFLVAGIVEHETGEKEAEGLSGLGRAMPVTAAAAALGAVSMAGLPPMFGFIGKESLLEAVLHAPRLAGAGLGAVVVTGALFVTLAGVVLRPFLGGRHAVARKAHEAAVSLWIGPLVLGGLGLGFGLAPWVVEPLLAAAAGAVRGSAAVELHLALWHGFNAPLLWSGVAAAAGLALFAVRGRVRAVTGALDLGLIGPDRGYSLALRGLNRVATLQTRLLSSGYLRYYVLITIGATVALAGFTLARYVPIPGPLNLTGRRFHEVALGALILIAALYTVRARSRMAAILSLGAVGVMVALLFLIFGAPDLAMTQFVIETLMAVLFVLVFYHLPGFVTLSSRWVRVRDALFAVAGGTLMAVLTLMAAGMQKTASVSDYYRHHSYTEAHGRNIVNVILVDFRGLDTLGEITVLSVAGIGVYALMRLRSRKRQGT